MRRKNMLAVLAISSLVFVPSDNGYALEPYSPAEKDGFMDWCTAKQENKDSTCSCALKQLAVSVPSSALAQFLANENGGSSGFSISATAITVGASVAGAIAQCAN